MLLLVFLAHTLHSNGHPLAGHVLDSRAPEACDDINNCRKLFDIVWGCVTTIFACTWVSVHPNVPPPGRSWLALLSRRLRMMLLAILAPELFVGFAFTQFLAARWISKKFDLSITHGFFINMGGFVSGNGQPIATIKQLEDPILGPIYISAIRAIKAKHIMDKSKGDALSKGVALLQGLWFTAQCLARFSQRLLVTQLEVVTLAFAVVNIFIWLLWWQKPLDVQEPISVGTTGELQQEGITDLPQQLLVDRFLGSIIGVYDNKHPAASTSVPSFSSMAINEDNRALGAIAIFLDCLVGSIFGGVHFAAWEADFPSINESWMWKYSSMTVIGMPIAIAMLVASGSNMQPKTFIFDVLTTVSKMIVAVGIPFYVVARLFLIVLPFTALRALPPSAFIDVDWNVYIPHI